MTELYGAATVEDIADAKELLKQINREKDSFEQRQIEIVPSLYFSQYQTIKNIYFYYNSKFMTGDTDDEDDRKYFYNITRNPCAIMTKSIDFDTKDIRLYTADGGDMNVTWYMERDLKFWMKDQSFGKTLNRIFEELPIYGSVVLKEVNKKLKFVDLRNFIVEQTADSLKSANYIIERHDYTTSEFRKMSKKMGWDKVQNPEEVIAKFHQMKGMTHIRVYERYGEVKSVSGDGKTSYDYKRVFYADVGINSINQVTGQTIPYTGFLLREDSWDIDELPYWEFHLKKIPGRWLGVGYVELLFEPQIRENEIANNVAKATYFESFYGFQTKDPNVQRNVFQDMKQGEIVNVDSDITAIPSNKGDSPYFAEEHAKWMTNRNELTLIQDFSNIKSKQTIETLQQVMKSYFNQVQQNISLDIIELIYHVIIPDFLDNNSDEHTLRIVGQDLEKLSEIMVANETNKRILSSIFKGKIPTTQEINLIKALVSEKIKSKKELHTLLPKDFYKDAKFKINIDITGESRDNKAWAQTMMAAIQAITVDPTILSDPNKKKFFMWWLESQGVSPSDIDFTAQAQQNLMQSIQGLASQGGAPVQQINKGAGGGVSKPLPQGKSPNMVGTQAVNNG